MIQPSRLRNLNDLPPDPSGKYVLYWMQASQRTRFNHALEHAISLANTLHLPVVVCFGLTDDYPDANQRHYAFMLQGLADVAANLAKRHIRLVARHGHPPDIALQFAGDAAAMICDRGYTRHQKRWRDHIADHASCPVIEVESDVIVPVEEASDHAEYAARTIRPKITRLLPEYLHPLPARKPKCSALRLKISGNLDLSGWQKLLAKLKLDRSVPLTSHFVGGQTEARKRLFAFLKHRLPTYATARNEPADSHTSHLSPYLHFGQISPLEIAIAVSQAAAPREDKDAYLEELIVRRELCCNFVHYTPGYDAYESLPAWAKKSLQKHAHDKRDPAYTLSQLESASTHDPYWNAAQREMRLTGYMHNYMRMYWGKKILEWSPAPQEAYARTLHLNNKYFLDGRGPSAFTNVAWIFGLHDRPWSPERPIFGSVRYMNAKGLERKFDINAYVRQIAALQSPKSNPENANRSRQPRTPASAGRRPARHRRTPIAAARSATPPPGTPASAASSTGSPACP